MPPNAFDVDLVNGVVSRPSASAYRVAFVNGRVVETMLPTKLIEKAQKAQKKRRDTWRGAALARFIETRAIPFIASATEECENRRLPRITQRLVFAQRCLLNQA
jgi:hypothetical protein